MRHVIIGGSIAGISAAKSIRGRYRDADITMISSEDAKPYYRPMVSALIERNDVDLGLGDPVADYGVRPVHDSVTGLDARSREVSLASGKRLYYDKLLIATGSRPVIPEIHGIQGPGVFALRTMDDALAIQSAARKKKHAVVLGGGFVGIKAAIALRRLGLQVTIIEKLDRVLYEKTDKSGSRIVAELLKKEGIEIATNQEEYEVLREGATLRSVMLASGRIIDADLIVLAVGTRPNTEPFIGSGMKVHKGIVIRASLETSLPNVYAAGDVVEYRDVVLNTSAVSASWPNAEEMGRLAGLNMTGANIAYNGFLSLMTTVDILGARVTTIGLVDTANAGYEVFTEGGERNYRKLVFKKDVLVGALFIGLDAESDMYAYLIKNQVPLGTLKAMAIKNTLAESGLVGSHAVPFRDQPVQVET